MRKVQFKGSVKIDNKWTEVEGEGLFHQWGLDSLESDCNINWTVAIVEMEDGNIIMCNPTNIKFIN